MRATIMGLGRFGGGLGAARALLARGASLVITDQRDADALAESMDAFGPDADSIEFALGGHDTRHFTETDLVVVNPAVPRPWTNPYLRAAQENNVPCTTEILLLLDQIDPARVIGVTGSAGKSTTVAMIHHALGTLGLTSHLGGNIGGSLLDRVDAIAPDDVVVLELSSAMLHWFGERAAELAPQVGVLTNIEPNHLDWHGTFEHYAACKERIFARPGAARIDGRTLPPADVTLRVPGTHNRQNAAIAAAAVTAMTGEPRSTVLAALGDFAGLPHRLQPVTASGQMRAYNDSKSTTPGATVRAVRAFDDADRIHLIVGGYDKGSDLSPIIELAPGLAGFYTIGTTGPRLAEAVPGARACGDLAGAVETARDLMGDGDILLLSPGCASWDQFDDFEARGRAFIELVRG